MSALKPSTKRAKQAQTPKLTQAQIQENLEKEETRLHHQWAFRCQRAHLSYKRGLAHLTSEYINLAAHNGDAHGFSMRTETNGITFFAQDSKKDENNEYLLKIIDADYATVPSYEQLIEFFNQLNDTIDTMMEIELHVERFLYDQALLKEAIEQDQQLMNP